MKQFGVHAALLLFFLVAAVAMTWPLAPNLHLALAHPGDPLITSWILDWDYHALTHHPARLFHANIFHPLRYTLAFTENMLGVMLVMLPFFLAQTPLLALHNVAILLGFALAGYGAALLGRHVTGSVVAGVAAGIFFAFVPWRFTHLTHLQHLWTVWLPLLVLAMLRLLERPTRGRAAAFAAAFVMNGLTNLHWLAFGSFAIACCVVMAGFFAERVQRLAFWKLAAVAFVCGSVALAPLLVPYARAAQLYQTRGDRGETLHYSTTPSGWLIASLHNRLYGPRLNDGTRDPEQWAFPGLVAPLLALAGVVLALRRSRLSIAIGLFLFLLGFVASLGLHTPFGRLLFDYVPLFRGIRAPARWAMIAYLGLALLAAIGTHALARRRWIGIAVCAVLLLELRAAPIRWYLATGETPEVYRWLARQQLRGAVLELPMDQPSVYAYLFHAHVHHQPLINGVSGFKPPAYAAMEEESMRTPIPPSFYERFRAHGGSLVIAHDARADAWARRHLVPVAEFANGDRVYATPEQRASLTPPQRSRRTTQGVLEHPVHWEEITGALEVRGRVTGAARRVTLYFDNRRTRIETQPSGGTFVHVFEERPKSICADTDLQVEVVDTDGEVVRTRQVWLRWRRANEALQEAPLPQTADLGPYRVHPRH